MKLLILFIQIIAFPLLINAQTIIEKNKPRWSSIAYGYIIGQEYVLSKIKTEHPDKSNTVFILETSFSTEFKNVKLKIEKYLTETYGIIYLKNLNTNGIKTVDSLLSKIHYTETEVNFKLAEIQKCINWEIPAPYLKYLLAYKYNDNPEKEISDGFVNIFKTKGHIKSKGTDWQIKIPNSWSIDEADRPNIIQKFKNDNGNGNAIIMMIVKDLKLPPNYRISNDELDQLFSEKEAKKEIDDGGKFISFSRMTIDGLKGGLLISDQIGQQLETSYKSRMYSWYFVWKNQMYFLMCQLITKDINNNMEAEQNKFYPLFKRVANSIVILNKYK